MPQCAVVLQDVFKLSAVIINVCIAAKKYAARRNDVLAAKRYAVCVKRR